MRDLLSRPPLTEPAGLVYVFLPSKPGVGTSTLALNVAVTLSERPETPVLLADFDLNNGILAFMLKLECQRSVADAAENAGRLDDHLWARFVTRAGKLDLLGSGRTAAGFRIQAAEIRQILDFARRRYQAICIDLSGNMEQYSLEIMHEAKRIFLVCTQELPSLRLAREKLSYLRFVDLKSRVSVVVNRVHKRALVGVAQFEDLLGMPVSITFPNDYAGVHRAFAEGRPVSPDSELGKQFRVMADQILSIKPPQPDQRRFVEYFSLPLGRPSMPSADKKGVM